MQVMLDSVDFLDLDLPTLLGLLNVVGLRTGDRVLASLLDWAAFFTSCEGVLGLLTGLLTRPLIVVKGLLAFVVPHGGGELHVPLVCFGDGAQRLCFQLIIRNEFLIEHSKSNE